MVRTPTFADRWGKGTQRERERDRSIALASGRIIVVEFGRIVNYSHGTEMLTRSEYCLMCIFKCGQLGTQFRNSKQFY